MKLAPGYDLAWDALLAGLEPDPDVTVSGWADEERILPKKSSAWPGIWQTSRTPYLKRIMDVLSPFSPVREASFMKASQIGGSEVGFNWIGHTIGISPRSMLMIQPTEAMLKKVVRQRIDPMIDACPRLKRAVVPARARAGVNNTFTKEYQGGTLLMGSANSAVNFRSMPVPCLNLEEIDGYPLDVDGEGDPIELALARARTFYFRKVYLNSTPTLEGRSRIADRFLEGTQEYYMVPCPGCGFRFRFVLPNLKWEKSGRDLEARYLCENCGLLIEEHEKTGMMAAALEMENDGWVAMNPDADPLTPSFHLSSFYSPVGWLSWKEIAQKFKATKKNTDKLRVFVNTILGETYKEKGKAPPWEHLFNRRAKERWEFIPKEALFLTFGADLQKDRIEVEIVAWGRDHQSWGIDYRVFPCDTTDKKQVLGALEPLFTERWQHELGGEMGISMGACDAGHNAQVVYSCARELPKDRFMAIRGMDRSMQLLGRPKAVDVSYGGRTIARGASVWSIGVSMAKSELYAWLDRKWAEGEDEPPTGWCHFPSHYDAEFFKMLCSEELTVKVVNSTRRYIWDKIQDRNEALDCRVYARAAASRVGLDRFTEDDWLLMENELRSDLPKRKPKPSPESDFWAGHNTDGWL